MSSKILEKAAKTIESATKAAEIIRPVVTATSPFITPIVAPVTEVLKDVSTELGGRLAINVGKRASKFIIGKGPRVDVTKVLPPHVIGRLLKTAAGSHFLHEVASGKKPIPKM